MSVDKSKDKKINLELARASWEAYSMIVKGDFYLDKISPDIIIDFNPLLGIKSNEATQRFPNTTAYVVQPNEDLYSYISNRYGSNHSLMLFNNEDECKLSEILDIHLTSKYTKENPLEIVYDFTGLTYRLKNTISIEGFISKVSETIASQAEEFGIEDFENENISIYIAFCDYYIANNVESIKVPKDVQEELIRTEDYKRCVEMVGGERGFSDPSIFLNYLLYTASDSRFGRLYPKGAKTKLVNRFSIKEKDINKLKQLGEVIHFERFMTKETYKSAKEKNININFNNYFNMVVKF